MALPRRNPADAADRRPARSEERESVRSLRSDDSQRASRQRQVSDERKKARRNESVETSEMRATSRKSASSSRRRSNDRSNEQKRTSRKSENNSNKPQRELNRASREAIMAAKKNTGGKGIGGLTLDQMRQYIGEQEDFDDDDLNKSAELFLSKESRTPPDKEEMRRLKMMRKKRAQEQRDSLRDVLEKEKAEDRASRDKYFNYDED